MVRRSTMSEGAGWRAFGAKTEFCRLFQHSSERTYVFFQVSCTNNGRRTYCFLEDERSGVVRHHIGHRSHQRLQMRSPACIHRRWQSGCSILLLLPLQVKSSLKLYALHIWTFITPPPPNEREHSRLNGNRSRDLQANKARKSLLTYL